MVQTTQRSLQVPTVTLARFEQFLCRLSLAHLLQVFDRFPPNLVFVLAATSYTMSCLVECYAKHAWNIDAVLQVWFPHPLQFRMVLKSCCAIMAGIPALQFFDRSATRHPTILDIFVRFDGLYQMGRFLLHAGYIFQPDETDCVSWEVVAFNLSGKLRFQVDNRPVDPNDYFTSGRIRTYRFTRFNRGARRLNQTICLTLLRIDPVKWILAGQTSTLLLVHIPSTSQWHGCTAAAMTFVTSSYAVSIFPRETFVSRKTYACNTVRGEKDISWDWITEYFGPSYGVIDSPLMQLIPVIPREVTTSARRIGDSRSWVVKFVEGMGNATVTYLNN